MLRNLSVLALAAAFSIQAFAGAPSKVKVSGEEKVRKAIDEHSRDCSYFSHITGSAPRLEALSFQLQPA
ncbi:MAG: hypothetical protein EOP07_21525 [Proteobacteria bacterium]|nr:MAG: hypothetical protein EOP07_21525 [Pseudomonadota bacterium]